MLRNLYSAVSGLKSSQQKMDVIGNNIANVNTTGFKKGQVNFSDMLYQQLSEAAAPNGNLGGTNGKSIGLGTKVSSINTIFTQGAFVTTGRPTDLAIENEGFFCVSNGQEILYTRNGNFGVDSQGNLVTAEGYKVLGQMGTEGSNLQPIKIPLGETLAPNKTSTVVIGNNLKSSTEVDGVHNTSIEVFDNLGTSHILKTEFKKNAADGEWTVTMSLDPASPMIKEWLAANVPNYDTLSPTEKQNALNNANDALLTNRTSKLVFDKQGLIDTTATQAANGTAGTDLINPLEFTPPGADTMNISFDVSSMTQYASNSTATSKGQDGNPAGTIKSITFDSAGTVYGVLSGGYATELGKLTLATFTNNEGLKAVGNTMYVSTNNSGEPLYGVANADGKGSIGVGYLEASNIDLSSEVTDMIITQRMYSMNAKMITVADEMLQELVNIKR